MPDYQVIARKFRPQIFKDVIGQEAIVTTLKNAIAHHRLAQAYLFCGSRGTGKTTLARLLAKALNCDNPSSDHEPCSQCSSCREISAGSSLEVLEIDGASHRGIEDIRQINETVGYAAASGRYKIYIIDEVHMLTKEAFNALLKTLEEPPPKVIFLFATTEPNKLPSTILSRCQRFNLRRIPLSKIVIKLRHIAQQLNVEVEESALMLLAQRAEGGLRDAESLFDQILAFESGPITTTSVTTALGLFPREIYFTIDVAGKEGKFAKAFEIADQLFAEGKELPNFIEGLIDHLRNILLTKMSGPISPFTYLTDNEKEKYAASAHFYSQEQCVQLIEYLLDMQNQLRTSSFSRVYVEMILLHVMRSHFRLTIDQLVRHLGELEQRINANPSLPTPQQVPLSLAQSQPIITAKPPSFVAPFSNTTSTASQPIHPPGNNISVDPTPSAADLGKTNTPVKKVVIQAPPQAPLQKPDRIPDRQELKRPQYEYDTLFHFAAVELEGKLQKN